MTTTTFKIADKALAARIFTEMVRADVLSLYNSCLDRMRDGLTADTSVDRLASFLWSIVEAPNPGAKHPYADAETGEHHWHHGWTVDGGPARGFSKEHQGMLGNAR